MKKENSEEMGQLRVNGRVVAEWNEGTIHVLDHRDGVETRDGWPGT